ncbi:hypothetical protein FB451DRAFT_1283545 [Mycena latifolia]|nr:hypothetical protein FB451DRAFT_1283545 [Mycena latifolia]
MNTGARIPAELLDEIVVHFSPTTDRETLRHLSLTNRRFHRVSHPLLFANFKFHPYSVVQNTYYFVDMAPEDLILPLEPVLNRARQRLEFWVSEKIATCVLECEVDPLDFEYSGRTPPPGEDPYALLAAFFQALPRFVNLQHFSGFHVHFTRIAMMNLCTLPKLSTVSIKMCHVATGEILDPPSKMLELDVLTFCDSRKLGAWWFRALCLNTLRVLDLGVSEALDQDFFFGAHSSVPRFPNVHTLRIDLRRWTEPSHLFSLSKFPAVKSLTLAHWLGLSLDPPDLSPELHGSGICPLLVDYTGPYQILKFIPFSNLRTLTIDRCNLNAFIAAIHPISKPNNIDYLEMTLDKIVPSLGSLSARFPVVKTLLLNFAHSGTVATDHYGPVCTLLNDLPSSLPPNIAKLALNWDFHRAVDPPDLHKFKDDVLSRRPTLKALWIRCYCFAYVWSEMPDGHQTTITGGPEVAASILPDFDRLFNGNRHAAE